MNESVVAVAEEGEIAGVGRSAVSPPDHVVHLAEGGRGGTGREGSDAVAGDDGGLLGWRGEAAEGVDALDPAGGGQPDPVEDGVAGQAGDGPGGQGLTGQECGAVLWLQVNRFGKRSHLRLEPVGLGRDISTIGGVRARGIAWTVVGLEPPKIAGLQMG